MPLASKTFRIFVSSTFSDMKEERNALQREVFPKLRDLCMKHGCRFQAIDLRWGLSNEATIDQQTVKICLEEITRCQKVTRRPNFLVLLGDRYGWRPLPYEIPAREFMEILGRVNEEEKELLLWDEKKLHGPNGWYRRDDNALYTMGDQILSGVYVLQPRNGEFIDPELWSEEESRLRAILVRAVEELGFLPGARHKYLASATEQEIVHGALHSPNAQEHVFCFFRTIRGIPKDKNAKDFLDFDREDKPDDDAGEQQNALKDRLDAFLPKDNIFKYETRWLGNGIAADHITALCRDVEQALSRIIEKEIEGLEEIDPLEKEISDHKVFGEERAMHFTGRAAILQSIADYIKGDNSRPLAIYGESGSGKSALMARAVQEALQNNPGKEVSFRFIGATPGSSDGRTLLESICRQISRRYGFDENDIPADYKELVQEFPKRLASATREKPLVLFLDSLDQLSGANNARDLPWLPAEMPEHVKVIVSTTPGECLSALERKLPETNRIRLEPMPLQEGKTLLRHWLEEAGRDLRDHQVKEVEDKFAACGLPLYLKLAFEEARKWKSYAERVVLSPDIPGLIIDLFKRLAEGQNHGGLLVSRSLGYLEAAKNGLSEDELIDVLSLDAEVFQDFIERAHHEPPERKLPVVVWSRLYFDLEPYLTERAADGATLMTFYHRQFGEVVKQEFLSGERHKKLARYFAAQPLYLLEKDQKPNLRKVSELPYQQTYGEMWEELYDTLTDFKFLEAKCTNVAATNLDMGENAPRVYGGVYELQSDYERALIRFPGATESMGVGVIGIGVPIITAVKFPDRGTPVFRCPKCLQFVPLQEEWLGNVIACPRQGCGGRLKLNPFVASRSGDESHARSRFDAPMRGGCRACDRCQMSEMPHRPLSQASQRALLAAYARTLTQEMHYLAQWPTILRQQLRNRLSWADVLLQPLSRSTETADSTTDIWLHVRNNCFESEALVRTLGAPLRGRRDNSIVGVSPDGRVFVWWRGQQAHAEDKNCLEVWSAITGYEEVCLDDVHSALMSPDGSFVVCGFVDKVRIYDVATQSWLPTTCRDSGYLSAISPDGLFFVSIGSLGHTLSVYATQTGEELLKLDTEGIERCLVSPDGSFIATVDRGGAVSTWDVQSGRRMARWHAEKNLPFGRRFDVLAVSPDSSYVLSAGEDRVVRRWNPRTGAQTSVLSGHQYGVTACRISPDGTFIVTASLDYTLKIWDADTGKERATLSGHLYCVNDCTVAPDASFIVSASGDHTLKVWDSTGEEISMLAGHSDSVRTCVISPDGAFIVSTSYDGTAKMWSLQDLRQQSTVSRHVDDIQALAISPDGTFIVSASNDQTLKIWDVAKGEVRKTIGIPKPGYPATSCAVTPDGKYIATASDYDQSVSIWDIASGRECAHVKSVTDESNWSLISDDGAFIVRKEDKYRLSIVETHDGQTRTTLPARCPAIFGTLAISPDGSYIACSTGPQLRILRILDSLWGEELGTLIGHEKLIMACAISPDGATIVTGDRDGTLKVWDAGTSHERATLVGHTAGVEGCTFTSDDRYVVSTGSDRTLRLWNVSAGTQLALLPLLGDVRTGTGRRPALLLAHPWLNMVFVGDSGGNVYLVEIEGVAFEPTSMRTTMQPSGPVVRCDNCGRIARLKEAWQADALRCPNPNCGYAYGSPAPVAGAPSITPMQAANGRRRASPWWQFWRRS